MPTARYDVAVATYSEWMAVACGQHDCDYLDSVKILNSTEKQWYSAAPLPMGCTPLKSAVVRDEWYLMVCYNSTDPVKRSCQGLDSYKQKRQWYDCVVAYWHEL